MVARSSAAWGKFCELLPILSCQSLSWKLRGKVTACVNVVPRPSDHISTVTLYQHLCVQSLDTILRSRRLGWYGHICRNESWLRDCNQFVVPGPARRGRPKKTWSQTVYDDVKTLFRNVDPINRQAWKAAIKNWTSTSNPWCRET